MKKTTISIIVALIATLLPGSGITGLQAQTAIPASGGNASGSGGSVSYSVGQVFYNTNKGITGSVTEGVQQPFEISVLTGLDSAKGISLNAEVYPNPATDYLILKVDASTTQSNTSMIYQLYDVSGKMLETKKLQGSETKIGMTNRVAGSYFLKIINLQGNDSLEIKTFKIIKN